MIKNFSNNDEVSNKYTFSEAIEKIKETSGLGVIVGLLTDNDLSVKKQIGLIINCIEDCMNSTNEDVTIKRAMLTVTKLIKHINLYADSINEIIKFYISIIDRNGKSLCRIPGGPYEV